METGQHENFSMNFNCISQLSYHYTWDSIFVDIPIKETFKKIRRVEHITKLVNLAWHNVSLNDKIKAKIDIDLTVATLGYTKITYDKVT